MDTEDSNNIPLSISSRPVLQIIFVIVTIIAMPFLVLGFDPAAGTGNIFFSIILFVGVWGALLYFCSFPARLTLTEDALMIRTFLNVKSTIPYVAISSIRIQQVIGRTGKAIGMRCQITSSGYPKVVFGTPGFTPEEQYRVKDAILQHNPAVVYEAP